MPSSEPRCLLCETRGSGVTYPYGTVWNGRRFDCLRCDGCGSSFVDPLPSDSEFERMYDQSNYHDQYYDNLSEEPAATRLPEEGHLLKSAGRLLDFGCGNGAFMIAAQEAGYHCDGVELEESARRRAALNSGCGVFSLDDLLVSGRKYDVIHLGDVLEHLPAPAGRLRVLERLLERNGVFFIEGPLEDNASLIFYASRLFGWTKKIRKRVLHSDLPPFHLFRTNALAQRSFFETRMGYEVLSFTVYESGWPYWNTGDRIWRPRSPGHFIKMGIGLAGLAAAKMPFRIGNRFSAVIRRAPQP